MPKRRPAHSSRRDQTIALLTHRQRFAEERYHVLLEAARDAIGVLDTNGVILDVNQRWEQILGVPRQEIIGRNVAEFAPDGRTDEHMRTFETSIRPDGSGGTPAEIRRPDGRVVLMEFVASLVDFEGERLVFSVGRDVSERLALEQERKQLTERVCQMQKLEALGQLAGGVAHDFNNVLAAVLGNCAAMLSEMAEGDPRREILVDIHDAGTRGAALTRQLLAFSRRAVVKPEIFSPNSALLDLRKMLLRLIGEDVELVTDLAPDLGAIELDRVQLEQIVLNLVINARDAMPGGGRITLQTRNAGDWIELSCIDDGCGMDEATKRRIFEPFFTTKEAGKGTGLGLATVYGIVQTAGGAIDVETSPGKGSTFRVRLPRRTAAALAGLAPAGKGQKLPGVSVLLVEDNRLVRAATRRLLESRGISVLEAADVAEAEATLRVGAHADVILSDLILPGKTGAELAARAGADLPPVLLMSGYTDHPAIREQLLTGMVLQKPFDADALLAAIAQALPRSELPKAS
jgi:two-component system, cell cycle sensor histidine kinase and response regulator CckA